jgi:hypothetical protein
MERISQAADIVRRAENEIRELLLRYATEGAYDDVAVLADWAQQLRRLRAQSDSRNGMSMEPVDVNAQHDTHSDNTPPSFSGSPRESSERQESRPRRKTVKTKAYKADYPRFFRGDRDELVKIGWSKKQKAEYRHKAPKEVVLAVARALQARGSTGEQFTFEELLPLRDSQSKSDVPSYQAYLTLAWLRKQKLVVQHGRQGYSLPLNINLMDAIEERWKLLPRS